MTKVIPQRSRKGVLLKLLAIHSSIVPPKDPTHCCICPTGHNVSRWKKSSFTLTEFGRKLASLMMEKEIEGNICCNSAYVQLYDYYYSEEGSKKVSELKSLIEQQPILESNDK